MTGYCFACFEAGDEKRCVVTESEPRDCCIFLLRVSDCRIGTKQPIQVRYDEVDVRVGRLRASTKDSQNGEL
jgi:hypothetical protein